MIMIFFSFVFLILGSIFALIFSKSSKLARFTLFSNFKKPLTTLIGKKINTEKKYTAIESILHTNNQISAKISVPFLIIGCFLALIPSFKIFISGIPEKFNLPYSSYFGNYGIEVDSLSAFFLLPILVISIIGAIFGYEYMKPYKRADKTWFFYGILTASMMGVVISRNGLLFLLFWEIMSISSFFLVSFENHKKDVRSASFIYLVASQTGAAFLLLFFALMWVNNGTLDFNNFVSISPLYADFLFILAIIGFGTKSGFIILHVWLPEAHPAAPSHVSAIMSGVMVKTGIYGILRSMILIGVVHAWWGWFLILTGAVSGIFGILFTLTQRDLKKLLAYSTVENIGIITLGIGLGILGMSYNQPFITVMGFCGSLLHVINHSLFKSLLFMSTGSVIHSTGTRDIEKLGGLFKQMPWTSANFLIGSLAISSLPPLNGFISEFLIYLGALHALNSGGVFLTTLAVIIIISLAFIGALAVLSFTRAFGITFLGNLREEKIKHIHESGFLMLNSMFFLSATCIFIGLAAPFIIYLFIPVIHNISFVPLNMIELQLFSINSIFLNISLVSIVFFIIIGLLGIFSYNLRKKRIVRISETWSCGYDQLNPRMQYTAYSFSKPVTDLFNSLLRSNRRQVKVKGLFPVNSYIISNTPEIFYVYLFRPVFSIIEKILARFKWIQHGNLQLYVFYITFTLIILLVWKVH